MRGLCASLAVASLFTLCGCSGTDDFGRLPYIRSVFRPDPSLQDRFDVYYLSDRVDPADPEFWDDHQKSPPDNDGKFANLREQWADAPACGVESVSVPAATANAAAQAIAPYARLCKPEDHPSDAAAATLLAERIATQCNSLLLYVHGFNTVFHTALFTAAQMARDTRAQCAAVFSFASEGKTDLYTADIEHSAYAVPLLAEFLRALSQKDIHLTVLAHSMGNRITLAALSAIRRSGGPARDAFVSELVLAAADVSDTNYNDDFHKLVDDAVAGDGTQGHYRNVRRVTIYASAGDAALATSEVVHDGTRAGREPLLNAGDKWDGPVDVIDATFVPVPSDFAGHGYFSRSPEAVADISYALAGISVDERLKPLNRGTPLLVRIDKQANPCRSYQPLSRYAVYVDPKHYPSWLSRLVRCVAPALPSLDYND